MAALKRFLAICPIRPYSRNRQIDLHLHVHVQSVNE